MSGTYPVMGWLHVLHDPDAGATYLQIRSGYYCDAPTQAARTIQAQAGLNIDLAEDGAVVGIEILWPDVPATPQPAAAHPYVAGGSTNRCVHTEAQRHCLLPREHEVHRDPDSHEWLGSDR